MRAPQKTRFGVATLAPLGAWKLPMQQPANVPSDIPVIRCAPERVMDWKLETVQVSKVAIFDSYPFGFRALVYQFGAAQAVFFAPLDDVALSDAIARWRAFGQGAFLFDCPPDSVYFRGPRAFVTHAVGNESMRPEELIPYWVARAAVLFLDQQRRHGFTALPGVRVKAVEAFALNLPMLTDGIAELEERGWNPSH